MSVFENLNLFKVFEIKINPFQIEQSKIKWLTQLRWVVISLFFGLSIPFYIYQFLNRSQMIIYVGLISILLIVNIFTILLYVDPKKDVPIVAVFYQLTLDLIMATSLLFVAGSFSNPFCIILILNTFIAGFLLNAIYSIGFLLLSHSCVGILQFYYLFSENVNLDNRLTLSIVTFHFINLSCWFVSQVISSFVKKYFDLQIQQANAIERTNRLKAVGALAAGFSHEFASPLNAAKLSLDRALRNLHQMNTPKNLQNDLYMATESLLVCESIVNQMNTSQMDIGSFKLKKVNLCELLDDVIQSWLDENEYALVKKSYHTNIEAFVPVINFAQVVINLLDNANQASSGLEIQVDLAINNKIVELTVRDQGPGFSKEIIEHVGEPFISTKKNGTGLGLYVTGLFAESLGGKLIISNSEKGGVVKIIWPHQVSDL